MTTAYLRVIKGKVRLGGGADLLYNEFDVSSIDGGGGAMAVAVRRQASDQSGNTGGILIGY